MWKLWLMDDVDRGEVFSSASGPPSNIFAVNPWKPLRLSEDIGDSVQLNAGIDGDLPDYVFLDSLFFASSRLTNLLREFAVNAQFIPVKLTVNGVPAQKNAYYFVNLFDAINAFDRAHGKYTMSSISGFEHIINTVESLAVDDAKLLGKHFVRLIEAWPTLFIASDALAQAVIASGMKGVKFIDLHEYSPVASQVP